MNLVKVISVSGIFLLGLSGKVCAGEVTATFNDGETLTQEKLDNVKSAINDNDTRLTLLENGPSSQVSVDCSSDADALLNISLADNTEYVLTGVCNGPIEMDGRTNVSISGDGSGSKDDGITLPLASVGDGALLIRSSLNIVLDNIQLSASDSVATGNFLEVLSVADNSLAKISNVNLTGGDNSISAHRNSTLRILEGVSVTSFQGSGISSSRNGYIEIKSPITVTGSATPISGVNVALYAGQGGIIRIRAANNGSHFTPTPSSDSDVRGFVATSGGAIYAVDVNVHGQVWAEKNGIIELGQDSTLFDGIYVRESGLANISGPDATVQSEIDVRQLGSLNINNATSNAATIAVFSDGALTLNNTPQTGNSIQVGGGRLNIYGSSASFLGAGFTIESMGYVEMSDAQVTGGTEIQVGRLSLLSIAGGGPVDLNFIDITCTLSGEYTDNGGTVNNRGTDSGC